MPDVERTDEQEQADRRAVQLADQVHDRLVATDPEGHDKWLADRQRRLAANVLASNASKRQGEAA